MREILRAVWFLSRIFSRRGIVVVVEWNCFDRQENLQVRRQFFKLRHQSALLYKRSHFPHYFTVHPHRLCGLLKQPVLVSDHFR